MFRVAITSFCQDYTCWVERSKLSASGALQARAHTHKQTNTQVLVSEWHGSTRCGVSLVSSISTPRKTSMALFDPPLKVCLKRAMDGWRDGGDTPHQWAWPAASGSFSPHSYHPIKYGTQRQRRRDWSKRRGRWGDSTPSL